MMCAGACRGQKRVFEHLKLYAQAVVNHLMLGWELNCTSALDY